MTWRENSVDNGKIKKAMTSDNDKKDNIEDLWKKNRQLKKKKQYLKQAAARAKACQ